MSKLISSFVALLALVGSVSASADNRIILGQPAYGGNGCPGGTAAVSVSPNQDAISILFDQYTAEAGNTNGRTTDRKACNISIPVTIPQGYSVALFSIDYRGYNSIPAGGSSRFDATYFWAGSRGPQMTRVFNGPIDNNYTITDNLIATALVWTPCGASVNLRANTAMTVRTNNNFDQTMSTVDSADVHGEMLYHIQWRRCQ